MFRLPMRKIITLFGLLMMLFVIVNVQFGSVAPQVIDGADGYKLDAFLMFDPSCAFDTVEQELKDTGTSYCLGEVGQWSGADVLMLMEGLFLFVYGFELPQNKGWARRLRKLGFIMGSVLCTLAVLDRLSLLPTSASSEGLATMFPFPVQPWVVQIMFAVLGVIMIRGPKYWEAEAVAQTRDKARFVRDRSTVAVKKPGSSVRHSSTLKSTTSEPWNALSALAFCNPTRALP